MNGSSQQQQQDDQDPVSIKAEERRRRLAEMMMDAGQEGSDTPTNETPGTAVFTTQPPPPKNTTAAGTAVFAKHTTAGKRSGAARSVPTELSDLESKTLARQEQVSRWMTTTTDSTTPTTTKTTTTHNNEVTELESLIVAKQQLPRDSATQVGAVAASHTRSTSQHTKGSGRTTTSNSNNTELTTLEAAIAGKQRLHNGTETNNKARGLATLRGAEQNALEKQDLRFPASRSDTTTNTTTDAILRGAEQNAVLKQRLPSGIPPAPSSTSQLDDPTDTSMTTTMMAELVDDEMDEKQIVKEAHEELMSKAVVASSVKVADKNARQRQKNTCWLGACCFVAGIVLLVATMVGGICGAGLCGQSAVEEDPVQRAAAITELVNTVTLRETTDPVNTTTTTTNVTTPQEEALTFLIEIDPLQLSVAAGDTSRLIQRYALTVLWYTNGPWGPEATTPDPQSLWFVKADECQWLGVECNNEGHVVELDLPEQGMQGQLPADIALLTQLTALGLETNYLSGTIPSFLVELSSLEELDLSRNYMTGPAVPTFLSQLPQLQEYNIELNFDLNGTLPEFLVDMTQLTTLLVSTNDITGTIPDFLGDMTWLKHLDLRSNSFSGPILTSVFAKLPGLQELYLGGRSHTGSPLSLLPLSDLRALTRLGFYTADFQLAPLPDEMGDWWPDLEYLYLQGCNISGRIPASIVQWEHLENLSLSNNKLTGPVPQGIYGTWSNLTSYRVGVNDLTGTLPETIGSWSNLEEFDVRNNAFRGTLPTTIGLMTNLKTFMVNANQFSGVIPSEAKDFGWYQDNNFTGTAPFCSAGSSAVDARVDCGSVQCECCSDCE